jgi:mannose-6-phosphate isomerase-like protein (cupin superfamily)
VSAFSVDALLAAQAASGEQWHEFFRVPDLSCGLYVLEAGGEDPQSPHPQDELYLVLEGRGALHVDGEDRLVAKGDLLYVAKHAEHRFHSIAEDLKLLVIFAPAYTGRD